MKKTFATFTILLCIQCAFAQVSYYKGEWTMLNKHDLFTGIFKIGIDTEGKARAEIVWTFLAIDSSSKDLIEMYKGKKGRSGIEYAEGYFSASTNDLTFQGKISDDPFVILGLDKYHIKLSADKKVIYGTTETQGTNEGMLYAVKLPDASGAKEFIAAKARVKK